MSKEKTKEKKWEPFNQGGLPSAFPKLTRQQWAKFRKGNYKDIWVQRKNGRSQLTAGELHLLKSIPKLKENETNASFQARVQRWEGTTGIRHPNRDKGVYMSHKTDEGRALAGVPRLWGLETPKNYNNADYDDEIDDLVAQKNYNPNRLEKVNLPGSGVHDKATALLNEEGAPPPTKTTNKGAVKIPGNEKNEIKINDETAIATGIPAKKVPNTEPLRIKSDVFTIDPSTGEAVGVLTRSQRAAFEARPDVRQNLLIAQKPENSSKLRIYKNQGGMLGQYERTAGG